MFVRTMSSSYSFISRGRYSARSSAQVVIMVVVVVVVDTDTLLLVLLHQTFIVSNSLERPPYFFPDHLAHPSQGSVLGGAQFNNPNGIKHPYRIGIVPVAVTVPLVPVLDVIVIVCPPCNYSPAPYFLSLAMGSVTCVNVLPDATERLIQQKKLWLEKPRTIDAELVLSKFYPSHLPTYIYFSR